MANKHGRSLTHHVLEFADPRPNRAGVWVCIASETADDPIADGLKKHPNKIAERWLNELQSAGLRPKQEPLWLTITLSESEAVKLAAARRAILREQGVAIIGDRV